MDTTDFPVTIQYFVHCLYPDDPNVFDVVFFETMKQHALKFKARTFYAPVGLANALDYELPVTNAEEYVVNYPGIKEV